MGESRINPETGVLEEDQSVFGGTFGHDWQPAKNDQGRVERVNTETGIVEEDQSVFGGTFGYDFEPAKNDQGRVERVNTETGVHEEDQSVFGGTFGYDFEPAKNDQGRAERINPKTGVHEEDQSLFHGFFGRNWQTKEGEAEGRAIRAFPGGWRTDKKGDEGQVNHENVVGGLGYAGSGQQTSFSGLLLLLAGVPVLLIAVGAVAFVVIAVVSHWGNIEYRSQNERGGLQTDTNQLPSPTPRSADTTIAAPDPTLQSDESSETLSPDSSESSPAATTDATDNRRNERPQMRDDSLSTSTLSARTNELAERMISAAFAGRKSEVNEYLNQNVDVDAKDEAGYTALIGAAEGGHDELVRFLLKNGAYVDSKNSRGETALIRASERGHNKVAQALLESWANVNERDYSGETPLTKALRNQHKSLIKLLRNKGGIE